MKKQIAQTFFRKWKTVENFAQRIEKNNDIMLEKIKQEFYEMQQENSKMMNELELKVKRMLRCFIRKYQPITRFGLVSRFRFEIIKELKINKKHHLISTTGIKFTII